MGGQCELFTGVWALIMRTIAFYGRVAKSMGKKNNILAGKHPHEILSDRSLLQIKRR